jgi:hypothetical protein
VFEDAMLVIGASKNLGIVRVEKNELDEKFAA